MAHTLHRWLPRAMQTLRPWMSDDDIPPGRQWSIELDRSLKTHRVGIVCVTPENCLAPWLAFEAGALSRSVGEGGVIPLLLGMTPSTLEGPLKQFQPVTFTRDYVWRLLSSLNAQAKEIPEEVLRDSFEKYWPELEEAMNRIVDQRISVDAATIDNVVRALAHHGIENPVYGHQVYFEDGFETHELYSTVTNIATRRLLIFGRKNRKLFDKDHHNFLKALRQRISAGFDFRVMFLDPDAPPDVLYRAHRDSDLADQLRTHLRQASRMLQEFQINSSDCCRMYRIVRTISFIVADDAVIYSSLALDEKGRSKPLTRAPFAVVGSAAPLGRDMVANFDVLWKLGDPISYEISH